jgi:hypothetical protein
MQRGKYIALDFTGMMPGGPHDKYTLVANLNAAGKHLRTNMIWLPDPAGARGFRVGRKLGGQPFGLFVPVGFQPPPAERIARSFAIQIISNASGFTVADLQRAAERNLLLQVIVLSDLGVEKNPKFRGHQRQ